MRLFIALPLSNAVKSKLQRVQQSLPAGIRKQQTHQMHITLRFLGEVSSKKTPQLKYRLANIEASPFSIKMEGVGTFPQKGMPNVIWAGIKPSDPLLKLQQKIEKVSVKTGFSPEKRTYIPHITLGRVKKASKQTVDTWMAEYHHQPKANIAVNQFVLFQSRSIRDGTVHQALKTFHF